MCSSLFLYHGAPAAANVHAEKILLLAGPHDSLTGGMISHYCLIRIIAERTIFPYDNEKGGQKDVRKQI